MLCYVMLCYVMLVYRYRSQAWHSAEYIDFHFFQVFGMTRLWFELTTSRSGGERSTLQYQSVFFISI